MVRGVRSYYQGGDQVLVVRRHHAHSLGLLQDRFDVVVVTVNNNLPSARVLHFSQHFPANSSGLSLRLSPASYMFFCLSWKLSC